MGVTRFPHGVSSFGVPVLPGGGRFASPWATHYFVDGVDGSDANEGKEPDKAFSTIQHAIDTATGGDVIYIRPKGYTMGTGFARYTEDVDITNVCTGSGVTETKAGISIIGVTALGVASDFMGPRWKHATTHCLHTKAAATHVENIGFFCEGATYGVQFQSDGATYTMSGAQGSSLYNCAIKGEGGVFANSSDSLQFVNCQFQAEYSGNTSGIIITLDGTNVNRRPVVRNCHFIGGNNANMDSAPIIWTGVVENGLIADNYFHTGTTVQINIVTAGSTGLIVNNFFAEADLSTTFIVQQSMVVVSNWDYTGTSQINEGT
uniref:Pectate lyase n=1 Tax=viral metagenome TaxID=1070528 RepID=A0A6H1Z6X1_9ZZZZ